MVTTDTETKLAMAPAQRPEHRLGAWAPVIFFAGLVVLFGVAWEPSIFLTIDNLASILNNGAVLAILACGSDPGVSLSESSTCRSRHRHPLPAR